MILKQFNTKHKLRIEHAILHACKHPAVQNPLSYNFDSSRFLAILVLLSFTLLAIWSSYINEPTHAMAPIHKTMIVQLSGN